MSWPASVVQTGPGLRAYAEAVAGLAAAEVTSLGAVPTTPSNPDSETPGNRDSSYSRASRAALAESAVVGMVLYERVLIALHRLAQEDASSRHFG